MRIAVIGAGFTGLSAAWYLTNIGHWVDVYEADSLPGGLAVGFSDKKWAWPLEKHYHHLFTSDKAILDLAEKIGHPINFYRPTTSTWISRGIFPLDSPFGLLRFPGLSLTDRLRTGMVLAFLKLNPFWQSLETITTEKFIKRFMGLGSWKVLWEPLMVRKFWDYSHRVSATWFWARIFKRSASLGYPEGGFQKLADTIKKSIKSKNGKFYFNTAVKSVTNDLVLTTATGKKIKYDKIICTLSSSRFLNICPDLPSGYQGKLSTLIGIGAANLVLSLTKPLLPDQIYWLNVNIPDAPFLSVVEHTHFISSHNYSGQNLVYIGNYLKPDHKYFRLTADQLLREFFPYLKKINSDFNLDWIKNKWLWKEPFAQPVITQNYSATVPDIKTPIANLYLANIQQVYPWDRGTNYAVELGLKAAKLCLDN